MNLKRTLIAGMLILCCRPIMAQNGLEKGFYCCFEVEGGVLWSGKHGPGDAPAYGLQSVLGYRFNPHLVLAGGAVGASTTALGKNRVSMIPLFVRLRSDMLDRPVSPYAELDLGYNFMLPGGNCAKTVGPEIDNDRRYPFGNGSREYLPLEGNLDWMGLEGEFLRLTLGVCWNIRGKRMSAGVSAGAGRMFLGTFVRRPGTLDGNNAKSLPFSRLDYLEEAVPGPDGTVAGYRRGDPVLTAGPGNRLSPSLSLRLSLVM